MLRKTGRLLVLPLLALTLAVLLLPFPANAQEPPAAGITLSIINTAADRLELAEGETREVTVRLNRAPTANIRVQFRSKAWDDAVLVEPQDRHFTPANWNQPQSAPIIVPDDGEAAGPQGLKLNAWTYSWTYSDGGDPAYQGLPKSRQRLFALTNPGDRSAGDWRIGSYRYTRAYASGSTPGAWSLQSTELIQLRVHGKPEPRPSAPAGNVQGASSC